MTGSIGLAIIDTLDVFVHDGRMEPQLAMKVLSSFDRAITEVLAGQVKARLTFKVRKGRRLISLLSGRCITTPRTKDCKDERCCEPLLTDAFVPYLKGHLDTYRFCDEVWTFLIKNVNFKLDNQNTVQAESVKIVSCNAKKPGEV